MAGMMSHRRGSQRRGAGLFTEYLEERQLMTVSPGTALVGSLAAGMPIKAASATLPTVASVAVVQKGDPLLGYNFTLVPSQRAYGYDLTQTGKAVAAAVPVEGVDMPVGSTLQLQVLNGLTFWNGKGQPNFTPVTGNVELNLNVSGQDVRIGVNTTKTFDAYNDYIRVPVNIGISGGLPIDRTMKASIGVGGYRDAFQQNGAPAGLYAFTGMWTDLNAKGVRDSDPVTFVFRVGNVSDAAENAALSSFTAPATRPVAVVDVVPQVVKPEFLGQTFLRLNVQFSDPVTVKGRPPQLPIFVDGVARWAQLEQNTPRVNTTNLSFVYTPTVKERATTNVRLGTSLQTTTAGSIQSFGGTPAIVSLPSQFVTKISTGPYLGYQVISGDIIKNTTLRAGTTYIIDGEVHVKKNVTLTIEDGVKVDIRNGRRPITNLLDASSLVFDSGSKLVVGTTTKPGTVYFNAVDINNREVPYADNGGVFFCGTYRSGSRKGITVDLAQTRGLKSSFTAAKLVFSYCGRTDPLGRNGDKFGGDDMDPISIIGMGPTEWKIDAVESRYSGNNGFDVTNSTFSIDNIQVAAAIEDGLNITSSNVTITKNLSIEMTASQANDRELFDLEADNGRATVIINQRAFVNLQGYLGGQYDEVTITSPDLPLQPKSRQWYQFTGYLNKGPARIWTRVD